MSIIALLEEDALRPEMELAALIQQARGAGAVVSFVGMVRGASKDGYAVDRLELEHHSQLTVQSLRDISSEAAVRFDVTDVRVVQRHGEVPSGEPIVVAGVAGVHRRAACEAADYLTIRLMI